MTTEEKTKKQTNKESSQSNERPRSSGLQNPDHPGQETSPPQNWIPFIFINRKCIALSTAAGIGLAFVAILLTHPLYQSRAKIIIGQTGSFTLNQERLNAELTPIEDMQNLRLKLKDAFVSNPSGEQGFVDEIKIMDKAIEVSALGSSPIFVQKFLEQILASITENHDEMLNEWKTQIHRQVDSLESQITKTLETSDSYSAQVNSNKMSSDQKFILTLDRKNLDIRIERLKIDLEKLKLSQLSIYSKPTQLLIKPTLPSRPARPSWPLYISLGLISGFALGIFLAVAQYHLAALAGSRATES